MRIGYQREISGVLASTEVYKSRFAAVQLDGASGGSACAANQKLRCIALRYSKYCTLDKIPTNSRIDIFQNCIITLFVLFSIRLFQTLLAFLPAQVAVLYCCPG